MGKPSQPVRDHLLPTDGLEPVPNSPTPGAPGRSPWHPSLPASYVLVDDRLNAWLAWPSVHSSHRSNAWPSAHSSHRANAWPLAHCSNHANATWRSERISHRSNARGDQSTPLSLCRREAIGAQLFLFKRAWRLEHTSLALQMRSAVRAHISRHSNTRDGGSTHHLSLPNVSTLLTLVPKEQQASWPKASPRRIRPRRCHR